MHMLKTDTEGKDWKEIQQMLAVVELEDYGWFVYTFPYFLNDCNELGIAFIIRIMYFKIFWHIVFKTIEMSIDFTY